MPRSVTAGTITSTISFTCIRLFCFCSCFDHQGIFYILYPYTFYYVHNYIIRTMVLILFLQVTILDQNAIFDCLLGLPLPSSIGFGYVPSLLVIVRVHRFCFYIFVSSTSSYIYIFIFYIYNNNNKYFW